MRFPLSPGATVTLAAEAGAELFHSYSRALCPRCRRLVDGQRILRDGKVYLRKHCPEHGRSEALISGDASWWIRALGFVREGSVPISHSKPVEAGCPHDCGLCPDHEQHSCLPIIEVSNHCNLECPICIVQNKNNWELSVAQMDAILDGLVRKEGCMETINFSGGEPTLHPRFLELVDRALSRPEIARVSVSTHGLRMAAEPAFCEALAQRGVYVSLQLDALAPEPLAELRGKGNHAAARRRALENLKAADVRTTLVSTVTKGVNEENVGECVELLFEQDHILSLMFQPAAYTGFGGSSFEGHDPMDVMTIPDVIDAIAAQSGGALRREDFLPLPCSHPSCFALTYLLKTDKGYVPFPRFIDFDRYLGLISNRGTMRADAELEEALRETMDVLWTSAGQLPDATLILESLRRALLLMYPEDRVMQIEERMRLGEGMVKTIFIHAFMDAHTFEVERIKKCCTHYALPDGRLMPGCSYNLLYRDRDPRFAEAPGPATIWEEPGAEPQPRQEGGE
ncbi:MAG: radical SAM protein [Myxococcales bacterium]|nr:radical SAM protein [Myxococcales bacterium]